MKVSFKLKVILPLLAIFAVLLLFVPGTAKWGYEYSKGQAWRYETLVAQFDFPILKTNAQIAKERAERSSNVIPYYKLSSDVSLEEFRKLESLDLAGYPQFKSSLARNISDIYSKGILAEDAKTGELIFVQRGKRAEKTPSSEVYLVSQARLALLHALVKDCPDLNVDSLVRANSVNDLIVPNLIYDDQLTDLVHKQNAEDISATSGYANAGTIIVNNGELVTSEIEQMLDSYKAEYEHNLGSDKPSGFILLGNALLILGIIVCLFFAMYFSNPEVFREYNRYLYILTVFSIMAVSELLFIRFAPDWIFLCPFCIGALYLQAFFKTKLIYPVYIVSLLPLLLFAENGSALFLMYLVSGTVTLYVFRYFSKGVKQFVSALITFAVTLVVFLAFESVGVLNFDVLLSVGMLFVGSMLIVAFHPFIFLLERAFYLVSSVRLQELCDTSNELLRLLEQKAPGTFQHSLQVMNLSSAAARAIGADENLVKAGALYHDVGKIHNPLCFVENESLTAGGEKYHDGLTPLQSAQDIIRHVSDGMELAHTYKLPQVVSDFIITHHGTTLASFFYDRYLNAGGDPSHRSEFCYPGPKPQTREQVILMLSDSVEAASRSLKDYSSESISGLVEKIFAYKIEEGQFEQADITVKELTVIKEVMKTYLGGIYHERIKYPKRKIK
jgi:cyclic-di-AMP phosphodiesterase PgpH